jgi:hypothetical protein
MNFHFIDNILHRKALVAIEGTAQQHITNMVSRIDSNSPENNKEVTCNFIIFHIVISYNLNLISIGNYIYQPWL